MIISVDTKHDSHDDIKKVITMLRHLVGEQQVLTNDPAATAAQPSQEPTLSNLFEMASQEQTSQPSLEQSPSPLAAPETKKSDADLFSDLFSEEDLPEAESPKEEPAQEEEAYSTSKKPKIEFY